MLYAHGSIFALNGLACFLVETVACSINNIFTFQFRFTSEHYVVGQFPMVENYPMEIRLAH